ncbi:MAG: beta-lactamase family protein [Gemmatimonadetes bacterium]|nr:beta-lactamase family protein [Gemmatimonadota bacterium]
MIAHRFALALLALTLAACAGARPGATPTPPTALLTDTLRSILTRARADSVFSGAIAVVGGRDRLYATVAVGTTDWAPGSAPIDEHTLWDLASLTKIVALTTTMATLVDQGIVHLDDPVRRWVPEWRVAGSEGVTVRDLLTHRSGLPAFKQYFKRVTGGDTVRALVLAEPLEAPNRTRMVYSDLGAIILGIVVERATQSAFDVAVRDRVLGPAHLWDTRFNPTPAERGRTAATERDPWRERLLVAEVHDENAAALGGVSAHAGLFSTASDMARFAQVWLSEGAIAGEGGRRLFRAEAARQFATVQDSAFSLRALGWDTPTGENSAGTRMKRPAYGHTGFTGTSLWIDPARGVFVVLLTNRVNPSRERVGIAGVRVRVADAVVGLAR